MIKYGRRGACSMKILVGNLKGRYLLANLGVDENDIIMKTAYQ
jgi:hypothetical protein